MVEAKIAQMMHEGPPLENQCQTLEQLDEMQSNGHHTMTQESQVSYGRRRGLPIEQRSQLWLQMKERKLQGQRDIKANQEIEGCTFEPNLKGGKKTPPILLMHLKKQAKPPLAAAMASKRPLKAPKTGKYGLPAPVTQQTQTRNSSANATQTRVGFVRQIASEQSLYKIEDGRMTPGNQGQGGGYHHHRSNNLSYSQLHEAKRHMNSHQNSLSQLQHQNNSSRGGAGSRRQLSSERERSNQQAPNSISII